MTRSVFRPLAVFLPFALSSLTSCLAVPSLVTTAAASIPRAAPRVAPDSLRPGEPVRLWLGEDAEIPARYDSTRALVVFFTRADDARSDTASLGRIFRIDVRRGKKLNPVRAFLAPNLGMVVGAGVGLSFSRPRCNRGDNNLCGLSGLSGLLNGGLVGVIIGSVAGLLPEPRWVTVVRPPIASGPADASGPGIR